MSGFIRRRRSGALTATFNTFEADLLRSLAAQLVELLRSEASAQQGGDPLETMLDFSGPTDAPEDPVLARLLPSAYLDDDEAAADFRRFTESELRDGKVASAMTMISSLEESGLADGAGDADTDPAGVAGVAEVDVELDVPAAMAWLRCFTDIRLALATRLGIEDDDEERWAALPEEDPRGQVHQIYQWVGFLQETLVESLS